jgi:hypothetical protein
MIDLFSPIKNWELDVADVAICSLNIRSAAEFDGLTTAMVLAIGLPTSN